MFKIEKTKMSDFIDSVKKNKSPHVRIPYRDVWYGVFGSKTQSVYAYCNDTHVFGIHKEKHRKVVKQCKIKGKNGHKVVDEAHWKITVYKFPIERVKYFKQHSRHFDVVLF